MLEEVRKILNLDEQADEQAVLKKLQEEGQALEGIYKALNLSQDAEVSEVVQAIEELASDTSDKDGTINSLQEENKELSGRVAKLEGQNLESEWQRLSERAMHEGRMTPKQADIFKNRFFKDPEGTKEIIEALEPVVTLGEKGSSNDRQTGLQMFEQKIAEKMEAGEVAYSEAAQQVARENPDLWKQVDQERRGGH